MPQLGAGDGDAIPDTVPTDTPVQDVGYGALEPGRVVGTGGNATVRMASVQTDPDRAVALKQPHESDPSATVVDRFRAEAETWATLDDHPHVADVHGFGGDPTPWIALEYADGGDLGSVCGACDVDRALWIGACVAAAVYHAHRQGVAHLDLKPRNVLLFEPPGEGWPVPKVADWGIANVLRSGSVNLEGLSPRYAAPEQFVPDQHGSPGPATDVYQLGVVVYELLVGSPPFDGPPRVLRDAVLNDRPPTPSGRVPEIPAAVDDLLDRALAKDPADRYGSMAAFQGAIERLFVDVTGRDPEGGVAGVCGTTLSNGDGDADAGVARDGAAATARYDRALSLADEGFVRLSDRYFARRDPAPPLEAWRRGVTLADARVGHAVERVIGDDSGAQINLTDRLIDRLAAGNDQVILGPPGSGKSTVCKRVACEWFERNRGPVFYRESGRGDRFDRPDALARRVTETDGHALVVVEDAVRPAARSTFDLFDRIADDPTVTFLVDAREGEWREAGRGADPFGEDAITAARDALDPLYVPRPDVRELERFVQAVETATNRSIDVDIERLREDVERAAADKLDDERTRPGELFYLLHRLTALARDPLADGASTTLTDAVGDVYDRLANQGEAALAVGVCVNVCNAAGVGVHPELLYAVAPDDPLSVDRAVEALEGRVLFPRETDWSDSTTAYPAIHEAWSTEFLDHCLDADDERAARERFGRVLTGMLSLADDPTHRQRVVDVLGGDAAYLARIDREPAAWADGVVEKVFGLVAEHPRLAPLFGTTETAAYDLPEACPAARRRQVPLMRGDAHRGASNYDRARSEYETALSRARVANDRERAAASLDGLGTVARLQNDHERAREYHERALAIARDLDDQRLEAEFLNHLGMNATRRDAYDRGREYVKRSLEIARDLGDRLATAQCLHTLGTVAYRQSTPEEARERLRESLEIKRELGDRPGVARSLNRLGSTLQLQGEHETAREQYARSLEIWRELGNRWWEAALLHNIGLVARERDEHERAREYHERALQINRELDVPHGLIMNLNKLGRLAERREEYERARDYHRRSLEISQDLDKPHDIARGLQDLGSTARGLGDLQRAQERLDRSLELYRDLGDTTGEADCLEKLGAVAHDRENYDEASQRYEAARALFEEIGNVRRELDALKSLVEVAREAGHYDRAREYCETAREQLDGADVPMETRDAVESLCGPPEARG